jgi:hypothetical protein
MGVCMLKLGTKHVSYFLILSLLNSNYSTLLLRTAFYVALLITRDSSFSECMQVPKEVNAQSGQIHQSVASASEGHDKFRTCQAPSPQQSLSPFICVARQPVRLCGSSSRHTKNPVSASTFQTKKSRSCAGFGFDGAFHDKMRALTCPLT